MTAAAIVERYDPPRVWVCHPDHLHCRHGHVMRRSAEFTLDVRLRVDGHLYPICRRCTPRSYFFGVAVVRPSLLVVCFAVPDEATFKALQQLPDDADSLDMLRFLGYAIDPFR